MSEKKKKHWIKSAINPEHKGALTKKAEGSGKSVGAYAHEHEHDSGTTGKQSRLAITLKHMAHAHKKHSASPKTIQKSMYGGE